MTSRDFAAELKAAREANDWDTHARIWEERRCADVDCDEAMLQSDETTAIALIRGGLHCDFDDKPVPLMIYDDSDPSVGLDGAPYLSLPEGYELVPSSFLRGIKRTMGEDAYEKALDIWQQIHDPNYAASEVGS